MTSVQRSLFAKRNLLSHAFYRNIWNLSMDASCFSFPSLIVFHLALHLELVNSPSTKISVSIYLPRTYDLVGYPVVTCLLHAFNYFCFRTFRPLCIGSKLRESLRCGRPWVAGAIHLLLANLLAGLCLLYLQRNKSQEVIGMPPGGLPSTQSLSRCSSDSNRKCCPGIYITDFFPGFRKKVPETPACFFRCR